MFQVFELLNSDEKAITTTDLECPNNNGKQSGLECLSEIRTWLQSLPLSKTKRSSLETMQLSDNAIKGVQVAVRNAVSKTVFVSYSNRSTNEHLNTPN